MAHKDITEARFPSEEVSREPLEDAPASRVAVYCPYDKGAGRRELAASKRAVRLDLKAPHNC